MAKTGFFFAAILALAASVAVAQSTAPTSAPATAPASWTKTAVPSAEAIKDANLKVAEISKAEADAAKTPELKKAHVAKLLGIAAQEVEPKNAPIRYALLTRARDIAQDAGDVDGLRNAVRMLIAGFEMDGVKIAADACIAVARNVRSSSDRKDLADEIAETLHRALDQDRFDIAKALAAAGTSNAQLIGDANLNKAALADTMEVRESELAFADVRKAIETLAEKPSDAEANLKVGKYRCFLRNDWYAGLPMLALGSDAALRSLAEKEVAGVTDSDEQLAIADAWWELAEKSAGTTQMNLRLHSGKWYQTTLPNLTGLSKARVEKRLTTIEAARAGLRPARIDLLALADATKDLVAGAMTKKDGHLKSNMASPMRMQLPYHPPAEYDFHIEFSRDEGDSEVGMILAAGTKQFVYVMGSRQNTLIGFELINKAAVGEANRSTAKYTGIFENQKHYDVVVKVRKTGVEAIINGKTVTTWKTDFSDMGIGENWAVNDKQALGLGTFRASATFYKIDVTEITGSGTALRK